MLTVNHRTSYRIPYGGARESTQVYVVEYIDGFPYIKPSLHPWDKAYLIMIDDHFDVFLDSFCEIFIEYFCNNIYMGNCSEVLSLLALSMI